MLVLLAAAWSCYALRRQIIGRFFVDGVPGEAPVLERDEGQGMPPAERVRVVLLDGLSREHAGRLDTLSSRCASGIDLVVDVGFPTVSLPVQHVLWTGLTQQQSGIQYRIPRIDPPPVHALPGRVADSVAIGESHRDIVHSFGFSRAEPALDRDEIEDAGSDWRTREFLDTALAEVASDAALVFVHVLRIDEAGHAHGGASTEYAQAAIDADAMLARMVEVDPAPGRTRWFVLADHGHREGGGHGDAEPEIRLVRGCIFGDVPKVPRGDATVHLVDFHRAIAESLALAPARDARGRTLARATSGHLGDTALPRPSSLDFGVAALLVFGSVVAAGLLLGRHAWLAIAWPIVSWLGVELVHGTVTLSNPVVYPPLGFGVMLAAAAGLGILVGGRLLVARTLSARRAVAGLMLPLFGAWLATAWMCGVAGALFGGPPPLMPIVSAQCSVLATVLASAFAVLAVVQVMLPSRSAPSAT